MRQRDWQSGTSTDVKMMSFLREMITVIQRKKKDTMCSCVRERRRINKRCDFEVSDVMQMPFVYAISLNGYGQKSAVEVIVHQIGRIDRYHQKSLAYT